MIVIRKMSLVDQVYENLRDRIINMQIPLGSKLTVSKLQEEYNVSSTPVREALNRLMNEGLIDFENNVGAKIIDITDIDVREIQELAAAYEMAAVYFAMEKKDNKEMAKEISKYIEEYKLSKDISSSCRCIRKIKDVFYVNANNDRLVNRSSSLKGIEGLLHNLFIMPNENNSIDNAYLSGIIYFEQIRDAVEEGDYAKVCEGLKGHRLWARIYILNNLEYIKSKYNQ